MAGPATPNYRGRVGGMYGKNLPRKTGVAFAPKRKRNLIGMVGNLQDGPYNPYLLGDCTPRLV